MVIKIGVTTWGLKNQEPINRQGVSDSMLEKD